MKTDFRKIKEAMFSAILGDAAIMNRLARPPLVERITPDIKFGKEKAVIQYVGNVTLGSGSKESGVVVMNVISYSHDLNDEVAFHLEKLFHKRSPVNWKLLIAGDRKVYMRREFADDMFDDRSQLAVKTLRFRVMYGVA